LVSGDPMKFWKYNSQITLKSQALWLGACFSALVLGGTGCQKKASDEGAAPAQNSEAKTAPESAKPLIGFSLADLKEERWQRDRDYLVAKVRELGGEVLIQDAAGDPNAQMRQCEGMLVKGIQALVVVPKNADAARPIVIAAHGRGVKVLSYDRLIADADVDLYLSFDNEKVGEIQATSILKAAPTGKYLILKGDPADKNSDMVHRGHLKILQPMIDKGLIQIVGVQSCDKWLRSEAQRITADALQKNDLQAIVASNDGTASGAIAALESKGLAGKVPVSGQDADLISCQYVWQGIQTVTVYKPIRQLAEAAATQAMQAARHGNFDTTSTVEIQNDGSKVRALFLHPIAVDKGNILETVAADGFHSREEITGEKSNTAAP
jgi:D-xylose transport system substrate-binding protein